MEICEFLCILFTIPAALLDSSVELDGLCTAKHTTTGFQADQPHREIPICEADHPFKNSPQHLGIMSYPDLCYETAKISR